MKAYARQKLKKFTFSIASLFVGVLVFSLSAGSVYASPATCTWTGGGDGVSWNISSNWSCTSGTIPTNGDNLVFNDSSLSNPDSLNDNISGLQINNISFTGNNIIYGYSLSGLALTLSGGITLNTGGANISIQNALTLNSNQTIDDSSGSLIFSSTTISLGSNTLTLNGNQDITINDVVSGSGGLIDNLGAVTELNQNNPSFSGPISINGSGVLIVNVSTPTALGSGAITIGNGASLQESINSTGTYTVSNPISLGGSGQSSKGQIDVHIYGGGISTVNFTGPFTLTADSQISMEGGSIVNINGEVSGCGYMLSTYAGSSGTLGGNLTGSCATTNNTSSSSDTSSGDPIESTLNQAVSAPNTGFGTPNNADPLFIVMLSLPSLAIAGGLRLLYWKNRD